MTTTAQTLANPFALMMNPEAVLAAMASSERLAGLNSRVCRPLDRPLIAHAEAVAEEADEAVDETVEQDD